MTIKINYEEPEDRPILHVNWTYARVTHSATVGEQTGILYIGDVEVPASDALEWARAVLKMVEQRHDR